MMRALGATLRFPRDGPVMLDTRSGAGGRVPGTGRGAWEPGEVKTTNGLAI